MVGNGSGSTLKGVAANVCLIATHSIILKYKLQHCTALRGKQQIRQSRWFIVNEWNYDDLLRSASGILEELKSKNSVVLPSEEHTT